MRKFIVAATLASLVLPLVPAMAQSSPSSTAAAEARQDDHRAEARDRQDHHRQNKRDARNARLQAQMEERRSYSRFDYNSPDPRYGNYYADRYYYNGNGYQARYLSNDDRIYRGNDNRYYCRRSDGTTGLIIGGIAGGLLGNSIARGDSRTVGTLLGIGVGAAVGSQIDRNHRVRCR